MWPDRVSNPGPLTLESDALPTALRGPADTLISKVNHSGGRVLAQYAGGSRFVFW